MLRCEAPRCYPIPEIPLFHSWRTLVVGVFPLKNIANFLALCETLQKACSIICEKISSLSLVMQTYLSYFLTLSIRHVSSSRILFTCNNYAWWVTLLSPIQSQIRLHTSYFLSEYKDVTLITLYFNWSTVAEWIISTCFYLDKINFQIHFIKVKQLLRYTTWRYN